jgi:hypothetical protein
VLHRGLAKPHHCDGLLIPIEIRPHVGTTLLLTAEIVGAYLNAFCTEPSSTGWPPPATIDADPDEQH